MFVRTCQCSMRSVCVCVLVVYLINILVCVVERSAVCEGVCAFGLRSLSLILMAH